MTKNNSRALTTDDIVSAVNSALRIISTLIIYIFHCNSQYNIQSNDSLFYAFTFFLFISGYYSFFEKNSPHKWIINRLKRIYIPYWIVIIGVILANLIFQYKEMSTKEIFFALIGGNLFVEHKIYVIAWFISVIICLYICVYIYKFINNFTLKILLCFGIVTLLIKFDIPYDFFISFLLGYVIHYFISRNKLEYKNIIKNPIHIGIFNTIYRLLFTTQNYSYEFFLLHGGVILFFTQVLHVNYKTSMYAGISLTFIGAIFLKIITKKIIAFIWNWGHLPQ